MRKYQVWLKGTNKLIEVEAEDVDVAATNDENPSGKVYYNFLVPGDDDDGNITVAAFPFDNVDYITSSPVS